MHARHGDEADTRRRAIGTLIRLPIYFCASGAHRSKIGK